MRRWTGIVLVTATASLLSACGSGSAPPPDSQPPAPSAASSTAPPRPPGPPSTSPVDPPTPPAGTDPTAAPDPVTTTPDPNTALPVPASRAVETTGIPGQPAAVNPPAGGGSPADSLDNTSSQWFDTFCSAISTAGSTRDALNSVNAGDAASEQSTLLGLLITMGDAFTSAAATLTGLGTPPVTAADTLITGTDQAQQLVQSVADIDLSAAQRAVLGQLPSCGGVLP